MIQNSEFYSTPEQKYLLIHKNACSTIRDNLAKEFADTVAEGKQGEGVSWAVVRDPYDRFVSSLAYDIGVQYPDAVWGSKDRLEQIIHGINYTKYIVNNVPHASNYLGKAQHSVLQTIYLFDNNIDILVDLQDLKHFIPMHFKAPTEASNLGVSDRKRLISDLMDGSPFLKDQVHSLLEVDYITLTSLRSQGRMWSWGSGKIW